MRIQTLCVCVCVCVCVPACVCVCDNVEGSLSWHAVVWVAVMCWSVTCSRSHCLLRFLSCQSASMTAVHAKTHRLLSSLLSVCFISLWHILYTHTHARTRACTHTHTHTHTENTWKTRTVFHSLFDQSYHIAQLSRFSCVHCHFKGWSWTWQLGVNHPDIGSTDEPWKGSKRGHGIKELGSKSSLKVSLTTAQAGSAAVG